MIPDERIEDILDRKLNEFIRTMYRYDLSIDEVNVWLNKARASYRFLQKIEGKE